MRFSSMVRILGLIALWAAAPLKADIMILVHGWNSGPETWISSGVVQQLQNQGWRDAGVVELTPVGILHRTDSVDAANKLYRASLPPEAPLSVQAGLLLTELRFIAGQNPGQSLILTGHSAGGLVARLALLAPGAPKIDRLITIATPNFGTSRALQGLEIAHGKPFFCPGPGMDFIKEMVGGDQYRYLQASSDVLVDLAPVKPGTLLDWLNRQPHPSIDYHAVIKLLPGIDGDEMVPAFSQDLARVPALYGRVQRHILNGPHYLTPADGNLLSGIVTRKP